MASSTSWSALGPVVPALPPFLLFEHSELDADIADLLGDLGLNDATSPAPGDDTIAAG